DLFAGAHGHTYGCHDIWQMYSPYREAVNGPHIYWQEAMDLPGANQMKYVKRLMLSRPFLERVPDQSLIVENNYAPSERIQATRGADYAFIYSAMGKPFTVNLNKISGAILNASWYNPRNGEIKKTESIHKKPQQKFIPPSSGYGQDWILILDDASKNYGPPGDN
ncbi:MAG TPA: putative collagen-binding domain-containing protein, partial [Agriterribacter sp.]|nr:putative collagen-binding domain-containing protein [Agriterribacter sp.]